MKTDRNRSRSIAIPIIAMLATSLPLHAQEPIAGPTVQPPTTSAAGTGGLSVDGIIESRSLTIGGFKFPDGKVQTAAMDASCPAGSAIRRLAPDGTVICETDNGSVNSVTAGAGLGGGTITNTGTIFVANGGIQENMLGTSAVTNAKIASGAITPDKLSYPFKASGSVAPADENLPPEENAVFPA